MSYDIRPNYCFDFGIFSYFMFLLGKDRPEEISWAGLDIGPHFTGGGLACPIDCSRIPTLKLANMSVVSETPRAVVLALLIDAAKSPILTYILVLN